MDRKENIRNFCIIAHIDHGKSTLADRLIEMTGTVSKRDMAEQLLDQMDLERERGITIKSQAVRMFYEKDGREYTLNLIDTPGHVDFTYEVSRSLAACEGAILIVDASQGIEAQTLANVYLALDHDLEILPVINKIDLPAARPDEICAEIEDVIGIDCSYAPRISAKNGTGIREVLDAIVDYLPAPKGDENAPLKALIFDSFYDNYKGALSYVRIMDGAVRQGTPLLFMAAGKKYETVEVGVFTPNLLPVPQLQAGDVGYIAASIKNVGDTRAGDTVTNAENPTKEPLPGYKKVTPMVFSGIYPADGSRYDDLREALEKLLLNDASLSFEPEVSAALGFGFRCGFLGLLHMEIIQERLDVYKRQEMHYSARAGEVLSSAFGAPQGSAFGMVCACPGAVGMVTADTAIKAAAVDVLKIATPDFGTAHTNEIMAFVSGEAAAVKTSVDAGRAAGMTLLGKMCENAPRPLAEPYF